MTPVVWGQPTATLGAEIAAAGGHTFLVKGEVGAGKSLLLDYLQALQPVGEARYEIVDPLAPRRSSELTSLAARLTRGHAVSPPRIAASLDLAFVSYRRLSRYAALVDRFAIHAELYQLDYIDLVGVTAADAHRALMRTTRAQAIQRGRNPGAVLNAELDGPGLLAVAPLRDEALHCLEGAMTPLSISNQARIEVLRVARTAADLEGELEIDRFDVALALCYRRNAAFGQAVREGWLIRR